MVGQLIIRDDSRRKSACIAACADAYGGDTLFNLERL